MRPSVLRGGRVPGVRLVSARELGDRGRAERRFFAFLTHSLVCPTRLAGLLAAAETEAPRAALATHRTTLTQRVAGVAQRQRAATRAAVRAGRNRQLGATSRRRG